MKIDWDALWTEERNRSPLTKYRKDAEMEPWDTDARQYCDSIKRNDYEYGRRIIRAIGEIIRPGFEVLDIGAGPGTLSIPLARLVRRVVAVDPSEEMIGVLEESAVQEGIRNIETMKMTWQEVPDADVRERFDIVVSSHVLWLFDDVGIQLTRMHDASRGHCCVVIHAGLTDDLDSGLWARVMKEDYNFGVDYIFIYNILHGRGIYANVRIQDHVYVFEKPIKEAIEHYERFFGMYTALTSGVRETIRDYICENSPDGVYRKESRGKHAVIWWKK